MKLFAHVRPIQRLTVPVREDEVTFRPPGPCSQSLFELTDSVAGKGGYRNVREREGSVGTSGLEFPEYDTSFSTLKSTADVELSLLQINVRPSKTRSSELGY